MVSTSSCFIYCLLFYMHVIEKVLNYFQKICTVFLFILQYISACFLFLDLSSFFTVYFAAYLLAKVIFCFIFFWQLLNLPVSQGTLSSILTGNIINWCVGCVQRRIGHHSQPKLREVSAQSRQDTKGRSSRSLFTLLPSGKPYRSMCCCTCRLQKHLFPPAVGLLNSSSALHWYNSFIFLTSWFIHSYFLT